MGDTDLLSAALADLGKPEGYVRHSTFQAICRGAAEAGDRAFVLAEGTNRVRLAAALRTAAHELKKVAAGLEANG
jgi:hypothetical protein